MFSNRRPTVGLHGQVADTKAHTDQKKVSGKQEGRAERNACFPWRAQEATVCAAELPQAQRGYSSHPGFQGSPGSPVSDTIAVFTLQSPSAQAQPLYCREIKLGTEQVLIRTGDPVQVFESHPWSPELQKPAPHLLTERNHSSLVCYLEP